MFKSNSSLTTLAQLLLKSHHEINEFFNQTAATRAVGPFNLGVRLGKTEGSMSLGQSKEGFVLAFSEDDRSYKLVLEPRQSATEPFKLKVTLIEGEKRQEHVFDGSTLFSAKMPDEFQALHARVLDYLKTVLPKELLAQFETAATAASTAAAAPVTPAASTVPASEADKSQPAAAPKDAVAPAASEAAAEDEYVWYGVRRQNHPDLRFRGKLIARVDSVIRQGRKTILQVFQTPSGKFVGVELGVSYWIDEQDRARAIAVDNLASLTELFGYSQLAKALYAQLKMTTEEVVE